MHLMVLVPQAHLGHARLSCGKQYLVGRKWRGRDHLGVIHVDLRNLLVQREDAAGIDGHLQPVGVADLMDDRVRLVALRWGGRGLCSGPGACGKDQGTDHGG